MTGGGRKATNRDSSTEEFMLIKHTENGSTWCLREKNKHVEIIIFEINFVMTIRQSMGDIHLWSK